MSPLKQRLAIVAACPQVFRIYEGAVASLYYTPGDNVWILTDLLNDLNAMHEAEATLGKLQKENMTMFLGQLLEPHQHFLWHASAAQRAEAFLKTLDLWTS